MDVSVLCVLGSVNILRSQKSCHKTEKLRVVPVYVGDTLALRVILGGDDVVATSAVQENIMAVTVFLEHHAPKAAAALTVRFRDRKHEKAAENLDRLFMKPADTLEQLQKIQQVRLSKTELVRMVELYEQNKDSLNERRSAKFLAPSEEGEVLLYLLPSAVKVVRPTKESGVVDVEKECERQGIRIQRGDGHSRPEMGDARSSDDIIRRLKVEHMNRVGFFVWAPMDRAVGESVKWLTKVLIENRAKAFAINSQTMIFIEDLLKKTKMRVSNDGNQNEASEEVLVQFEDALRTCNVKAGLGDWEAALRGLVSSAVKCTMPGSVETFVDKMVQSFERFFEARPNSNLRLGAGSSYNIAKYLITFSGLQARQEVKKLEAESLDGSRQRIWKAIRNASAQKEAEDLHFLDQLLDGSVSACVLTELIEARIVQAELEKSDAAAVGGPR